MKAHRYSSMPTPAPPSWEFYEIPQQPLLSPPWGSSIPTSQLSIKSSPPPWCKCTYPCTPGCCAFCAARTQRGSPRHGTGSLFFMSVLALALAPAPTLGQAHFSKPFPPGWCPLSILSLILLFNLDNGKCRILTCTGKSWVALHKSIALVVVRRVGQIKASLIASAQFLS